LENKEAAMLRGLLISVAAGAVALLAGAIALLSIFASGALPWFIGVVLAAAVVGVIVAGFHAGGHGWFVPVPVLVLAVAWAVAASAGGAGSAVAWALAALAFASALGGLALVAPAVAFRHAAGPPVGPEALAGATGTALTALTPTGICRVNNETWTAESLSGPLPAGAPVHVARVDRLRLLVWSEAGTVLGAESLPGGAGEQLQQGLQQEKEGV
jgi:membrane-bound ClpP family serine protease